MKPAILSIAGSDPSGGAGIQADLKTLTALGVYGGAAVTCLTVQNSRGVKRVLPLPADFVKKQIMTVLEDMNITHIKTGMMGNSDIIKAVSDCLRHFKGEIICDPVLKASDGNALMEESAIEIFKTHLVSISSVLTPNIPELEMLTGIRISTPAQLSAAAEKLFKGKTRLRLILVKGGHLPYQDTIIDSLFRKETPESPRIDQLTVSHPRIDSPNTHGTGCTFASAFSAYHLITQSDTTAFTKTVQLLETLLQQGLHSFYGKGTGPLFHACICKPKEEGIRTSQ